MMIGRTNILHPNCFSRLTLHPMKTALLCLLSLLCLAPLSASSNTDWIDDLGGAVTLDADGNVTGVDLRATWVTDTDLRKLNEYPKLAHLDLSLTHITDQGMQELKNLPSIEDLNLRYAEYVTDEGMAAIKGWKKLKRLNIHGTKASDTTLEHISGITTLESVNAFASSSLHATHHSA